MIPSPNDRPLIEQVVEALERIRSGNTSSPATEAASAIAAIEAAQAGMETTPESRAEIARCALPIGETNTHNSAQMAVPARWMTSLLRDYDRALLLRQPKEDDRSPEEIDEAIGDAIAKSRQPKERGWQATHRHYKGGLYREIARGTIEADLSQVVIYDDEHCRTWVRPASEFDGTAHIDSGLPIGGRTGDVRRFEPLLSPPAPSPAQPERAPADEPVVLEDGVKPNDVLECVRKAVDFAHQTNTRVSLPAMFVDWLYQQATRRLRPSEAVLEQEWQPIETAPNDGQDILTWDRRFGIQKRPADSDFWRRENVGPTHWQPLPASPRGTP
jgi:hypothetical protein